MVKAARVAIRMDDDLKERVEALAKADRRSISSWIEALVSKEVERIDARKARQEDKK